MQALLNIWVYNSDSYRFIDSMGRVFITKDYTGLLLLHRVAYATRRLSLIMTSCVGYRKFKCPDAIGNILLGGRKSVRGGGM